MKHLLLLVFTLISIGFIPVAGLGQASLFKKHQDELSVFSVGNLHLPNNNSNPDSILEKTDQFPLVVLGLDPSKTSGQLLAKELTHFTSGGYAVLEIHHDGLDWNDLSKVGKDILSIRRIGQKIKADHPISPDQTFFLPIGHRIERNVVFFQARGYDYNMDIRYPAFAAKNRSILLQITHKTDCRQCFSTFDKYDDSWLDALTLLGYTTAYADHYGSGFKHYDKVDWMPQFVHPAKAAVQFLRKNADNYQIDRDKIIAMGFSKGGTAAAMLAVTADEAHLELGGLYAGVSSHVLAAVVVGAHLDLPNLKKDAKGNINDRWDNPYSQWGDPEENPEHWIAGSAITYVSTGDAPIFLVAGALDSHRPHQSRRMQSKLDKVGVENSHLIVPGLKHKLPNDQATMEAILSFLQDRLK